MSVAFGARSKFEIDLLVGPTPLYVVAGRGGPNLVRGMGALAETCDSLNLPYRFFGFDSAISSTTSRVSMNG
jgi:hypothetical protein